MLERLHLNSARLWRNILSDALRGQCSRAFKHTLLEARAFDAFDLFGSGYAGLGGTLGATGDGRCLRPGVSRQGTIEP